MNRSVSICKCHKPGPTYDPCSVCIVNGAGDLLMDVFVRQTEPVTDYRTDISGEMLLYSLAFYAPVFATNLLF